jgi:RNA polymerase sigma-70 factor (ECF subfamily)
VNQIDRPTAFEGVMVETGTDDELAGFLAGFRPDLERALVARFGLNDGMDAASVAIGYAYQNWERLGSMENPAGYLYRVGVSSARRTHSRRRRTELLVRDPVTVDQPADVDLQQALARLRPEQRVAVVLVYAHGHSYAEAAEILDVPVTTITNHLNRGLARLRRFLEYRDVD